MYELPLRAAIKGDAFTDGITPTVHLVMCSEEINIISEKTLQTPCDLMVKEKKIFKKISILREVRRHLGTEMSHLN